MAIVDLLSLFNQDELGQIIQSTVEKYNLSVEQATKLASMPPEEQAKILEQLAALDSTTGLGAGAGYPPVPTIPQNPPGPSISDQIGGLMNAVVNTTQVTPTYTPPTYESSVIQTGASPLPADFFQTGQPNGTYDPPLFEHDIIPPLRGVSNPGPSSVSAGGVRPDNPMGGDVTSSVTNAPSIAAQAYDPNARLMAAKLLEAGGDPAGNLAAAQNYLGYYLSQLPKDIDPNSDTGVMSLMNTISILSGRAKEGAAAKAGSSMTPSQAAAIAMQQAQLAEQQRQFDATLGLNKDKFGLEQQQFGWQQSEAEKNRQTAFEREMQRIKEARATMQMNAGNILSTAEANKARLLGELAGRAIGNRQYWPGFEPGGTFANWSSAYKIPFTPQRMTPTTVDVGGITAVARDLVAKALAGVE